MQGGYVATPEMFINGDPKDDLVDWEAEYNRLIRLFEEKWELPGMKQIVNAITDVAFNGIDPAIAARGTIVEGHTIAVNQRNIEAIADFGSAIPADIRKYLSILSTRFYSSLSY